MKRDEVVDLLWRGVDEDKARNAFRQALHRLRGAVGEEVLPLDRERLRLVPAGALTIDLDQFDAALSAGRLGEAIDLSAGEFLEKASLGEPPFDMWVEHERARLRARLAQVLTDATAESSAAGRWAEAVSRSRRLLTIAPFEASSASLAATTLVSAGRRHEARDLLKQFASTLDAELGLPLPADLQALLNRLEKQSALPDSAPARTQGTGREVALPFVGREAELSQLVSLCRSTAEESGGFALVTGAAGIGKSRLLAELIAHIKSLGKVTVLHGREHVAGVQLPYAVFAEALRPLVRAPGIAGASRHLLAEAARLLPELRDGMELPNVTDVEDEAGRLRFFEGIAALMDAAAFERPIVILIDDVHLAGPSTLELLSYLCARLGRSAVTFVLTMRPDEAPAAMLTRLESLARADSQTHPGRSLSIQLQPIDVAAARDAVVRVTDGMRLDASVHEEVVSRAAGVPAQLTELVRRIQRGEPLPALALSIRESVVDRVARLTSQQRRLLFVVALIGTPTDRSVVGAAAHLPEPAIADALDALIAEGLVEFSNDAVAIADDVRRAALELAGAPTRAFLSGWIADELATRSAPPAELARFYATAGQGKAAFEQSRLAAFAALAVGALPEATHHLSVARNFAQTPEDLSAVESLLNALGAGHRQITRAQTVRVQQTPPPASRRSDRAADANASLLETLFPNWRMLLGAAVATLSISALVLADRTRDEPEVAATATGDTLIVAEDAGGRVIRLVTGDLARGFSVSERRPAPTSNPPWIDSITRPWANPLASPRGQRVALERITSAGSDLFLVSSDRRDTIPVLVNAGDARALGWSPDGAWLLASLTPAGNAFDAQLYAFRDLGTGVERRVIDATPRRSVVEAAWSPDGTRIAWVSRVGTERQLEVFVSNADGSGARNVSRHPADDQHIAWSPKGDLLAFASARDGNSELYALSFLESRLWRLTFDPAQDDEPHFSADGRLVAFESTRGGSAAVYVMAALGGEPRRVDAPSSVSVLKWTGGAERFVDHVVIDHPPRILRSDTASLSALAFDQFDEPLSVGHVEWRILDSAALGVMSDSAPSGLRVAPLRNGLARVVASLGGWRSDTALVALGGGPIPVLARDAGPEHWRALGSPRPRITASTISLLSDREWDSGALLRSVVPLIPGLVVQTSLQLPLRDSRDPAAVVSVALVEPEDSANVEIDAPQFLKRASLTWNAESGRLVYAVGREFFSEAATAVASANEAIPVQLRVETDSTVSFRVGGQQRWRSSLRLLVPHQRARAQLWISSRATGDRVSLLNTTVRLEPVSSGK